MTTLMTTIGDRTFENCMMNAAGIRCQTNQDLDALVQSQAGTYVTKSATPAKRKGNPSPRIHTFPKGSINSMGLPNNGLDYYLDYVLNDQKKRPEGTPFLSIAGTSLEDNLAMLHQVQDSAFTGFVELNLSCPNVPGKPQVGYDFDRVNDVLSQIFKFYTKPLGVKLPPYFDLVHFDQIADILNQYPLTFVNSINSIGNGLVIDPDTEQAVIKPKGGIGGAFVKPTALANVRGLALRLKPEISIVGTGGILNGQDAFEHILCGASMVQIGTEFGYEGVSVFDRISKELKRIMTAKGYDRIDDFKGQLKTLEG